MLKPTLKRLFCQGLREIVQTRGSKRRAIGSVAMATFGMMATPCLAKDQDSGCSEVLASSNQALKASYGPVVEAVELAQIENWENTPYHPGSEQLAFVLKSKPSGSTGGGITTRAHALMANQIVQASISKRIVQACPTIDVVSYRFENPDYAVSYSRQSDGLIRQQSSETLAQNQILLMP